MTLEEQIEAAYDFRGHVTLRLKSGEILEGYVFNRVLAGGKIPGESFIEVFPKGQDQARRLAYSELSGVALTGKDYAA